MWASFTMDWFVSTLVIFVILAFIYVVIIGDKD